MLFHPLGKMLAALALKPRIALLGRSELGVLLALRRCICGGRTPFYGRGRRGRLMHRCRRQARLAELAILARPLMAILRMQRRGSGKAHDAHDRGDRKDKGQRESGACAASWSVALHRNRFQGPIISKPPSSVDRGGGFVAFLESILPT
jgi:hypothetical protein